MSSALSTDSWQTRWIRLLKKIRIISSDASMEALLAQLADPKTTKIVAFVNAHAMNSAVSSKPFYNALSHADILLRDGSGMATLLRMLDQPVGRNLNGTDLIPRILKIYEGRRIALFGTRDEFAGRARDVIAGSLGGTSEVDSIHGFHDIDMYVASALQTRPDLIVLGMGMPKQELLAAELRKAITDWPCLIVCGGAILDFLGGKVRRAPVWVRNIGCEWAFRFMLEPRRLFKRYIIGNPVFLARSMLVQRHISVTAERGSN